VIELPDFRVPRQLPGGGWAASQIGTVAPEFRVCVIRTAVVVPGFQHVAIAPRHYGLFWK
jgi:hypothetical protein